MMKNEIDVNNYHPKGVSKTKMMLANMQPSESRENTKSISQDEVSNSDGMVDGGFLKLMAKIDVSTCNMQAKLA